MREKLLRTQKGQVAFFVILIFQVLFVFFAMVVNVGLLVHHKINLQNSVDLAAYYGAMKQAEMMNVIAHANYQIRQSYKLLAFHHNQIGTGGVDAQNPWNWRDNKVRSDANEAVGYEPIFCAAYEPFDHVNSNETYCRNPQGLTLPGIGVPDLASGIGAIFVGFQNSLKTAAEAAGKVSSKSCKVISTTNWFALARYMYAYKMDVRNRKQLILALANEVSKSDPLDVDGKSIREGVYKTLMKNLTYQNAAEIQSRYGANGVGSASETAKFEMVNGLALGDCGPVGAENEPPGWLNEVSIYPLLAYLDAEACPEVGSPTKFAPKYINQSAQASQPKFAGDVPQMYEIYKNLAPIISEPSGEDATTRLFKSSLGFEKNPWCMGYIGVSASATPKIPFSPLGDVKLVARGYAKPFGGRIGPWYSTTWASGQKESGGGTKTDKLAAMRVGFGNFTINENDPETRQAMRLNHSRYMGDQVGVRSALTISEFGRAIRAPQRMRLAWWEHLTEEFIGDKNQNGDLLAWEKGSGAPRMRDIEIASIAPDNFDTAYYSIDPDFYNNYLLRLQAAYGGKFPFDIRGDLGARAMSEDPAFKKFSIRNQIETLQRVNPVDTTAKLTYIINNFAQVLTSWQGANPYNYLLDTQRFGKCVDGEIPQDATQTDVASGSCVSGGRTGYSVKLVDGGFLKANNLELGGDGIRGTLKNPPPDNF